MRGEKGKLHFQFAMLVQQNYGGWLQNMTVFSKDVRHEIKKHSILNL